MSGQLRGGGMGNGEEAAWSQGGAGDGRARNLKEEGRTSSGVMVEK